LVQINPNKTQGSSITYLNLHPKVEDILINVDQLNVEVPKKEDVNINKLNQ
jgi:hypothetical protein